MLARDHALTGAIAFVAAAPLAGVSGIPLAAGAVLTAGAAVLPDIDEPGSTIARSYGFLTEAFAWLVHKASGGHRKGSHALIGAAVFTVAAWAAVHFDTSTAGKVILGVFLALLLSAAVRALRIGGHHGDALGCAAAAAQVWWHAGLWLVPWCIAGGVLAHIAGDMATHSGVPILWPACGRDFHVLPERMRFTTGKAAEHWIVTPLLLAALGFLIWRDASVAAAVHHLHTVATVGG